MPAAAPAASRNGASDDRIRFAESGFSHNRPSCSAGKRSPAASASPWASSPPDSTSGSSGFTAPRGSPIALSLLLTLPGLWLRGYAAGYVKKNRELTQTGPYAHTRNPLYLGSILIATGFAVALMSWPFALTLAIGFTLIYVPVIASEEAFLRQTFPDFPAYCKRVPRLIPRLTPGTRPGAEPAGAGSFSFVLYRKHREYNSSIGAALLYLSLLAAILLHSFFKV